MFSRVYVEITNVCNMNCSFCHGHHRTPRRISRDEFAQILDKLTGHTNYIYYHIMGEPLTHPDLPLFLRMAAEKGFRSVITTNGTLLSARGEELLAENIHKVSISLHSFEGENDEAFLKYLQNSVNFAKKASESGTIVVFRLWNKGFDEGKNEKVLSFLHSELNGEWSENTRGYRIQKKLFLEWGDRFIWPDKDAAEIPGEVFCHGMSDHFGILCDGSVVPCCMDSDGVINLGNIFRDDPQKILSSPRAQAIIRGFENRIASEDLCRRCAYAQKFL